MIKVIYTIILLAAIFKAQAQEETKDREIQASLGTGVSFYSIIDRSISNEKYSGIITPAKFLWSSTITNRQTRDFYLATQTGIISNNSVEARINEILVGWDYKFELNSKKRYKLSIGPSPSIYFHNRKQTISSDYHAHSSLGMISLATFVGISSNMDSRFNYGIDGRLGILTMGMNNQDDNQVKILIPIKDLQFSLSAHVSYKINNWLGIYLDYKFQVYHINSWDKFYSISDQLMLNLSFIF